MKESNIEIVSIKYIKYMLMTEPTWHTRESWNETLIGWHGLSTFFNFSSSLKIRKSFPLFYSLKKVYGKMTLKHLLNNHTLWFRSPVNYLQYNAMLTMFVEKKLLD